MENDDASQAAAPRSAPLSDLSAAPNGTPAADLNPAAAATQRAARAGEDEALRPSTPAERRRAFQLLYVALIMLGMGQTMTFAIVPQIGKHQLHLTEFQIGSLITLAGVLWFFASPYWGHRSEIWGRKPVILAGIIGYGISNASFGFAMHLGIWGVIPVGIAIYPLLILTRGIFGLLGPGTMVGAQAYIVDRTSRRKRTEVIAALASAQGVGTFIGPGFVGSLVIFGILTPFYAMAAIVLAFAVVLWVYLPERTPPQAKEIRPYSFADGFGDKRLLPYAIGIALLSMVQAVPIQTMGFYMTDVLALGVTESIQMVGVTLMVSAMAALFAQLVIVQRFGLTAPTLFALGGFIGLASYLLLALANSYAPLVMAMVLNGFAFGLARPSVIAASSLAVSRGEQGKVAGVMAATGTLGYVSSPLIFMPIYSWNHHAPYWVAFLLLCVLLLLFYANKSFHRDYVVTGEDGPQPPM